MRKNDKERIDVTCTDCGNQTTISWGNYRKKTSDAPIRCLECQNIHKRNNSVAYQQSLSEEAKTTINQKKSKSAKLYYANATAEQLNDKAKAIAEGLAKISPEKRQIVNKKISQKAIQTLRRLTSEERKEKMKIVGDGGKRWRLQINNNPEEYNAYVQKLSKSVTDYHSKMSPADRLQLTQKVIGSATANNQFHKKFVETFNSSIISSNFYIVAENGATTDNTVKIWDYGIYDRSTDQLVMLIDLDGAYYHGDKIDYNGIHSKEEYDERRYSIVPSGVKLCIIYKLKFNRSFEIMIKNLMQNYDQFIEEQFNQCRLVPFPYPRYTDTELWKSWDQLHKLNCTNKYINLSTRNREGDRIISHFHHSIWEASVNGKPSPFNAWHDDKLLKKVIENRMIYVNILNPNKILQGFNVAKIGQKVSVFSAGRAKLLIHRYLSEYDEVFDPFSGFSGRMLGAVSLGKKYIGQDISPIHVTESNNIIDFLGLQDKALVTIVNCLTNTGTYQCLFTCPPYGDKERWLDVPVDTRSCDGWIDVCLNNFKCDRYLFVVNSTERYNDNVVDTITNKSHFGSNEEYIVMI